MRSKIIFVLAITMGLVTTVLFYKYLQQFDTETTVNESMTEIYTAKQQIKENQRISAEMIVKEQMPQQGVHSQALVSDKEIVGKYATSELVPGEAILSHHLMDEKEESLYVSRKVHEGYRAVSIGVNMVQSVSNLIEPEDFVDVIFSEFDKDTQLVHTELILQKARVLAVGRRMLESDPDSEYVEYSTATLELNSQDAVTVVNADERGNIHLILHSRIVPPKGNAGEEEADAK